MEPTVPQTPPRPIGPGWLAGEGLLAAGVAWIIINQWYPFFDSGVTVALGVRPGDEEIAAIIQADLYNLLAVFGLLGGLLGVGFGLAVGVQRRSPRLLAGGIASGLLFGVAGGLIGGWCTSAAAEALFQAGLVPQKYRAALNPTIARACGWGLIGLGAGLGFSLPLANRRAIAQATLGGLVGGLIAAPCYQVVIAVAGMFAPISGPDDLVPVHAVTSAIWLVTASVVVGLAAGLAGSTSSRKKVEARS